MPAIPVASDKLTVIAMSGCRPAPARATLADGSSRVIPGEQAMHKVSGLPLYQLDCVIPGDGTEQGRMLTFTAKVASATRPEVTPGLPVEFVNLQVLAYVDQGSGRAALSWSADGAKTASAARSADRAA